MRMNQTIFLKLSQYLYIYVGLLHLVSNPQWVNILNNCKGGIPYENFSPKKSLKAYICRCYWRSVLKWDWKACFVLKFLSFWDGIFILYNIMWIKFVTPWDIGIKLKYFEVLQNKLQMKLKCKQFGWKMCSKHFKYLKLWEYRFIAVKA